MILKKPYGILIKYFKVIHLILYGLMILFAFKVKGLLNFFVDYVKNGYTTTVIDNMASMYVNWTVYILLFLILGLLITIFILLSHKKKPTKLYLITIIYYIIFFIVILIAVKLINGLSEGFWSTSSARQYRDISLMVYYSQILILIIMGIRTFGFDIKKFNFKKDIEELQLDEKDSELVEVNLNLDASKFKRNSRRFAREMGYYFKENTFIFISIFAIIIILIILLIVKKYDKLEYNYKQGENFIYNGIEYNVEDSIITNLDSKGTIISDKKDYVVIKLKIKNNTKNNIKFIYQDFKLYINEQKYTPNLIVGDKFVDYAKPYQNEVIKKNGTYTFQLAYEVNKNIKNPNYKIVLYNGESYKSKTFKAKTINVKINPIKMDKIDIIKAVELGEAISFEGTYIGKTSIMISNYNLNNSYYYDYQECVKDNCNTYKDFVAVDYKVSKNKTLMILDCVLKKDDSINNSSIDIFNSFGSIKYIKDNKVIISNVKNVTPQNLKDHIILDVDNDILNSKELKLLFTIRNKRYEINLKKTIAK